MRIVSLVPSLTETLFALGLGPDEIVGRTSWCCMPEAGVDAVRVVGGTKTPSLHSIADLEPDLVLLEREENTRAVHDELEARGIGTWVAWVRAVGDVPGMLRSLGDAAGRAAQGEELAAACEQALQRAAGLRERLPPGPRSVPLIWNDPLMAVGPRRYGGDLVRSVGLDVPEFSGATGYPVLGADELGRAGVELLLLTSEPHAFSIEEGDVIADAVADAGWPRPHPMLVDGRALTWFGARTAPALAWWCALRERLELGG